MQQLASHGLFNVMVQAEGDTWIDDHHTNEDIGAPMQPTFILHAPQHRFMNVSE